MHVLALCALLAAAPAPVQEDGEDPGPTKEEVRAALKDLAEALDEEERQPRMNGLARAAAVLHPDVAEAIADVLADDDPSVRAYAAEMLGRMDHAAALEELHAFAKRHRRDLPDDPEFYGAVLKNMARHRDVESLPHLTYKLFDAPPSDHRSTLIRTRILSIGYIRDEESVHALMDVVTRTARSKLQPRMSDVRLAMAILVGVDRGESQDRWVDWWNENRKTFELLDEPPKLPKEMQLRWDRFWGLERRYEKGEDRKDRGKAPRP